MATMRRLWGWRVRGAAAPVMSILLVLPSFAAAALTQVPTPAAAAALAARCAPLVPADLRRECGFSGIESDECTGRGCCWSPLRGAPSCYAPLSAAGVGAGATPQLPSRVRDPAGACPAELPAAERMDCGYLGISEDECKGRGCCWSPKQGGPWCFDPVSSYQVTRVTTSEDGRRIGVEMRLLAQQLTNLGPDYPSLTAAFDLETPQRLRVKIVPKGGQPRWEVPEDLLPRPGAAKTMRAGDTAYTVDVPQPGYGFAVTVGRRGGGSTLFNSTGTTFVYKPQYLEISTAVPPGTDLYGLGERTLKSGELRLPRDGRRIALWASDTPAFLSDTNLYGAHPFYLAVDKDGMSHGVLLLNSNAMEVTLNEASLVFRALGGVLDLYMFSGPSPEQVLRQYQAVVGRPAMPPYWALGFHQCRWGYRNVSELRAVVEGYASAAIPLEVIWSDIDWMDSFRNWDPDPVNFSPAEMGAFLQELRAGGRKWVPIIDAGIAAVPGYEGYDTGLAAGAFITGPDGAPYMGQVWPGPSHWPDFLSNATRAWWAGRLALMHKTLPFDGIWIDMNEPSNFCSGLCKPRPPSRRPAPQAAVPAPADAAASNGTNAAEGIAAEAANATAAAANTTAAANGTAAANATAAPVPIIISVPAPRITIAGAAIPNNSSSTPPAAASTTNSSLLWLPGVVDGPPVGPTIAAAAARAPTYHRRLRRLLAPDDAAAAAAAGAPNGANETDLATWLKDLTTCALECTPPPPNDTLNSPPYSISNGWGSATPPAGAEKVAGVAVGAPLYSKTLSMTARHRGGIPHYNAHNLYGFSQAIATAAAVGAATGRRPFVLSRSTFPGSGRHAAHWTGDNAATWDDLRWSVQGVLNANLFGIPLAGADICGFQGDTTPELCSRWISAGAFYTFSRNHNSIGSAPQELYRWPAVAEAARAALGLRYRLLPYLYSSHYAASVWGGSVAKPLFFADPADATARAASSQWLLGWSLLVSPALSEGASSVKAHFPAGTWYSVPEILGLGANATVPSNITVLGPGPQTLPAPLGAPPPLHARGGGIIPLQQVANTTAAARTTPVSLLVALQRPPTANASSSTRPFRDEGVPPYCVERVARRANASTAPPVATIAGGLKTAANGSSGVRIACGILYLDDGDSPEITSPGSALVWLTSVAAGDGASGDLRGDVARPQAAAAAGASKDAAAGLTFDEVLIVGLPPAPGAANGTVASAVDVTAAAVNATAAAGANGTANATIANSTLAGAANGTANGTLAGAANGTANGTLAGAVNATAAAAANATAANSTAAAGSGYVVWAGPSSPSGGGMKPVPPQQVVWDGARGVLRVTGLNITVAQGLSLRWEQIGRNSPGAAAGAAPGG